MNNIKGETKLNKTISAILKPFGISEASVSDEYAYIFEDEAITFKITENAIEDRFFMDFIEDRFDYKVEYPFIISLLHEVGHHKNNDEIEGSIFEFCLAEKKRIDEAMQNTETEEEARRLEYQYFNLPDEIMATAWAVNYAKKHPKKIKKLWKQAKGALLNFYLENGILEEVENDS